MRIAKLVVVGIACSVLAMGLAASAFRDPASRHDIILSFASGYGGLYHPAAYNAGVTLFMLVNPPSLLVTWILVLLLDALRVQSAVLRMIVILLFAIAASGLWWWWLNKWLQGRKGALARRVK
jgi:hypothetical protein